MDFGFSYLSHSCAVILGVYSPLATITPTQRRASRRTRAAARRLLFLHKTGQQVSAYKLKAALASLRAHHSRDLPALRKFQRDNMDSNQSWRCVTCMKICSHTHQFCGVCGKSWHLCADPTFKGKQSTKTHWPYTAAWDNAWTQNHWTQYPHAEEERAASPRRRQTPRRRSVRKNKQVDNQPGPKGKGKAKSTETDQLGPPSLPSMAAADPPWQPQTTSAHQQLHPMHQFPQKRNSCVH